MPWFGWGRAKVVATNENEKKSFENDDTNELDDDSPMILEDDLNEKAQDLMADNLEMMRDIVFRIREDEQFAKSIYADCPRLQHLLKQNPDLRPIFEDPNLIRINFEKVYRDQGGVLPEDEDDEPPGVLKRAYDAVLEKIAFITSHPLFKVFKVFMLIKKIVGLFSPTKGFGMVKGFFVGLFTDPDALIPDVDGDVGNPANLELKMQLFSAAEHMEDPEVQERMEEMLDNPESMDEAIENDPQLKALRDENELCRALMSDPDTMRILVDPDNLRALAEAPDLIEQDFADPGGFVPEAPDVPAPEEPPMLETVPEADAMEVEGEAEGVEGEGEEEEPSTWDEINESREDDKGGGAKAPKNRSRGGAKDGEKDEAKGWMQAAAGVVGGQALASLGVGDMFGGVMEDLGLEDSAPEVPAESPEVEGIEGEAPEIPEEVEEEPVEVELEMDSGGAQAKSTQRGGNQGQERSGGGGVFGAAMGAATGFVASSALGSVLSANQAGMVSDFSSNLADRRAEEEEGGDTTRGEAGEGEDRKGGRFAFVGALQDFAKDNLISSALGGVLGDDLAEGVLGVQEDAEALKDEDEDDDGGRQSDNNDSNQQSARRK